MSEIIGILQVAMPVVASVGIAVTVWLTMRGWRREQQRHEVERAKADARRDALLERNTAELGSLGERMDRLEGRVEEVREGLEQRIDGVRTDLTERIDGVRTDLTERIDGVCGDLTMRMEAYRESFEQRIQAHEDKCEARWLQQAKEFGEMRGALAALQRTVEAGSARAVAAGSPQKVGQR